MMGLSYTFKCIILYWRCYVSWNARPPFWVPFPGGFSCVGFSHLWRVPSEKLRQREINFCLPYNHKRILEELFLVELPDDKYHVKPWYISMSISRNYYDAFYVKGDNDTQWGRGKERVWRRQFGEPWSWERTSTKWDAESFPRGENSGKTQTPGEFRACHVPINVGMRWPDNCFEKKG